MAHRLNSIQGILLNIAKSCLYSSHFRKAPVEQTIMSKVMLKPYDNDDHDDVSDSMMMMMMTMHYVSGLIENGN